MKTVQDKYPVFEANQILSNLHLNQIFDYLNEQERLTRANLIGIGIVCGLEARLDPATATVHISRGCGVTSEGYLIVEPEDVALVAYRQYKLPLDLEYPTFQDKAAVNHPQYALWEMYLAGEPDTIPLSTPAGFLEDKAALLFLELKKEGLRNCSPNDCNDRGSGVTVTLRRLLITVSDLAAIIAESASLAAGLTLTDLESAFSGRLDLPDLRLPRYDVPNTGPTTSDQVLAAFQAVFHGSKLAQNTGDALTAAYDAFKPLIQARYPSDPFISFNSGFGFLDNAPATTAEVYFLQYYYDFFDDLIKAYDELRWKGAELLCACCPPESLFPRHLMLGVPAAASVAKPALFRQGFIASCAGEELTTEFQLLFQRLVGMVESFTHQPVLPKPSFSSRTDSQIRITPSIVGDKPLSDNAIPYYYRFNTGIPLFQLWSPQRSRRNRANQNLGYRSDEYTPAAPSFVVQALRYTLEPYNFLRIEGHLGKNFQGVLQTLLSLKTQYRLPIEIIALRTGAFDETMSLDLTKESAKFQDLETLYDVLREELLTTLCEGIRYLYDIPMGVRIPEGTPGLPLLKRRAANFRYAAGSVGAWYEKYLAMFQARPYIDVDQNKVDANAVLTVYCFLFAGTSDLREEYYAHVVSIYYLSKLSETLPASLDALGYADFENKYQDLLGLTRYFRSNVSNDVSADLQKFIPKEELVDHFDQVLYSCNLEPVRALYEEYLRRIREAKQKQFLGFFLQKHPGIQHNAGVPLGGTFIIVYHDEPTPPALISPERRADITAVSGATRLNIDALSGAFARISSNRLLALDPDIRFVLGTFTGRVPDSNIGVASEAGDETDKIIRQAVKGLAGGTVIADFFLPYLCCADSAAVQYILPPQPPGLSIELSCTDPNGNAVAVLTPNGGIPPITYQFDDQPFQPLTGPVLVSAGPHRVIIRDSAGVESAAQFLTVPAALSIGQESYTEDTAAMTYRVTFSISGGVAPYTADGGAVVADGYTSEPAASEQLIKVAILDSAGCKTSKEFRHKVTPTCDLPCDGFALRCGYRFWLPEPDPERPYKSYGVEVPVFRFEFPQGGMVGIESKVASILQADSDELNSNFDNLVQSWVKQINEVIASEAGSNDWLWLEYEREAEGMAVLWIEHFECLDFEFHVQTFFRRRDSDGRLDIIYTPKGTTIVQEADPPTVVVPPFNCRRIAKCDPARPVQELCKEVDLTLRITKRLSDNKLSLNVTATGNDHPVAFMWEVQDGIPPMSGEKKATFTFEQREPPVKFIRLTAYTEKGCMVIATDKVTLD